MEQTPLGQIGSWIDESERRIFKLERDLRRRRFLQKLLFFCSLFLNAKTLELEMILAAEKRHLEWLNQERGKDYVRNHTMWAMKAERDLEITKEQVKIWKRVIEYFKKPIFPQKK